MKNVQFDAFGEPVSYDAPQAPRKSSVSKRLILAAVGFYWTLVAVLVVARGFYFDPSLAGKLEQVAVFGRTLRAMFTT